MNILLQCSSRASEGCSFSDAIIFDVGDELANYNIVISDKWDQIKLAYNYTGNLFKNFSIHEFDRKEASEENCMSIFTRPWRCDTYTIAILLHSEFKTFLISLVFRPCGPASLLRLYRSGTVVKVNYQEAEFNDHRNIRLRNSLQFFMESNQIK